MHLAMRLNNFNQNYNGCKFFKFLVYATCFIHGTSLVNGTPRNVASCGLVISVRAFHSVPDTIWTLQAYHIFLFQGFTCFVLS